MRETKTNKKNERKKTNASKTMGQPFLWRADRKYYLCVHIKVVMKIRFVSEIFFIDTHNLLESSRTK